MKEDMQLQKGDSIQWNRETRMDRFGTGLGIHKGDAGKIVEAGPKPGQYLVEIQDQRFYAVHGHHFESQDTTIVKDSMKENTQLQKGVDIRWKKESRMDYFGTELVIREGDVGKIIAPENPGQYLVEFQKIRFYAMCGTQFEFIQEPEVKTA